MAAKVRIIATGEIMDLAPNSVVTVLRPDTPDTDKLEYPIEEVEIIADGVSYLMEGKISLKPGYRHTITVTLDKNPEQTKIDIGGEIVNW